MPLARLLLLAVGCQNAAAPGASPISDFGNIGYTTVSGIDDRTGKTFLSGEDIYGPFEAGFGSQEDSILEGLGCSPASLGYVGGGIDTFTAEQMIAAACSVDLPRIEDEKYVSVLDECGGHTNDYHFHEGMGCLYETSEGSTHSTKVGEAADEAQTPIYGKWEDYSMLSIPALDACNGHFGVTPDSSGNDIYHHHVAGLPPFTVGCYGPGTDPEDPDGPGILVSPQACRALYPGCGDGDTITVTTPSGWRLYDPFCPCFTGGFTIFEVADEEADKDASPSPSPPNQWVLAGCSTSDLQGDFDSNGVPTLGDAVFVANARVTLGTTGENPIACLDGDFDSDGSFTLNDAATVAEAQFGKNFLPWDDSQMSMNGRRGLTEAPSLVPVTFKRGTSETEVDVYMDKPAAEWKGMSVQFTNAGKIASVQMHQGEPGQIMAQHAGSFFQAAELGGRGLSYPATGRVATVTFEEATEMGAMQIDYKSMNSYVVLKADPTCKLTRETKCATIFSKLTDSLAAAVAADAENAASAAPKDRTKFSFFGLRREFKDKLTTEPVGNGEELRVRA